MGNIPNFPNLRTLWGAPYGANGGQPVSQNVDLSSRVLTSQSWKVGKQYELDSAQAGELTVTLRNNDALLDPTNASSPFAGHIAPYQSLSLYASYPPSVNRLTNEQAGGGQGWPVGAIPASFNIYTGSDPSGTGTIVAQAAAPGGSAFNFAVPAGTSLDLFICAYLNNAVEPGVTYGFSTNLLNTTAGVSGAVKIAFGWYEVGSTAGPSSWSYGPTVNLTPNTVFSVSATGTAPADATGLAIGFVTGTAAASAFNVETWNSQLELGSTVSAYHTPGTRFPLFTGWVERWPTQWRDGGQYGTISATGVDVMALLSQGQLSDPFAEEINSHGPRFLYRFDDPQNSAFVADATGNNPPAPITESKYGAGVLTLGNSVASTTTDGGYTGGAGGSVMTIDNPSPATTSPGPASFISLGDIGITGPANPAGTWSRMMAFRYTGPVPAYGSSAVLWSSLGSTGETIGPGFWWNIVPTTSAATAAEVNILMAGPNDVYGTAFVPGNQPANVADGNWHLLIVSYSGVSGTLSASFDGAWTTWTGLSSTLSPSGITNDAIGSWSDGQQGYSGLYNLQADLSYACEWPVQLGSTDAANLYTAWRNACSGETSDQRYARILRYAGYTGPTNLGNSVMTTDMGPATDLSGSDALSCLESVVTTENGTHWVAADGTLTFVGRASRYNRATPAYVFGENAAAGEWPYEDLKLDYDPTHLANDVAVTINNTGQVLYGTNSASQSAYFDRTMTRTVNTNSVQEAQDAANFLAWRYGQPLTRVSSITLNPAALSGLWPVALTLDIGDCIQINRRPPGCPEISLLVWIENRQWTLSDDGNAKLVLQCSPAITVPQAQFSVFRTLTSGSAASGQPTITVTPPTWDTVNPLNSYVSPGAKLVVGGSTLTVSSVQSTGTHWSTGTITFTTNLASTVAAGSTVSEQLFGASPISEYDVNSELDDVTFTY